MKEHLISVGACLLHPLLCRWDTRLPLLERLLDLQLAPHEFRSIRIACDRSSATMGEYYLWKLTQLRVIAHVRRLSKEATQAMVAACDHSDYQSLRMPKPGRGLLVAIPHHGHFVLSILGLIERVSNERRVYVFYEAPEQHKSNEIFDLLYERLYGDSTGNVGVLHNNRQGLARAIRELQRGSIVVILPDVYKNVYDTYQLQFFGFSRNVMLGTALLARRTDAIILPMVSQPFGQGLDFTTAFGTPMKPLQASLEQVKAGWEKEATVHADYRTMTALFCAFESLMEAGLIYWQYSRTHFASSRVFTRLTGSDLEQLTAMFFQDPRVHVKLDHPLRLN